MNTDYTIRIINYYYFVDTHTHNLLIKEVHLPPPGCHENKLNQERPAPILKAFHFQGILQTSGQCWQAHTAHVSFPQSYTGFEIDIYTQNEGYGLMMEESKDEGI